MTGARVIHRERPPWQERTVRFPGVILIESVIDRGGRVCAARLLKGSGPLAESAVRSLKRWRFEPARIDGRPIPVYFTVALWLHPQ